LDFGIGVVRDQFVIAMGGVINSVHSQSVSMLDVSLLSPCWVPIADMLVHRTNLGVGVLNDCIYAVSRSYINLLLILYLLYFIALHFRLVAMMVLIIC